MRNFCLGCLLFLCCNSNWVFGQKLYWVDAPLVAEALHNKSYATDTVVFEPTQEIWGIVQHSTPIDEVTIVLKNAYQVEEKVTMKVQPLSVNTLKFHPQIKKYWKKILAPQQWYYFEVLDTPTVKNAYEGVALLTVLEDILQKKIDLEQPQQIYYKLENSSAAFTTAFFDFRRGQGQLVDLLQKKNFYQGLIVTRQRLLAQQQVIEQNCTPAGFAQVQAWATEKNGLQQQLSSTDEQIFIAMEQLKIQTESVRSPVSARQKRWLRELLLLDIDLLNAASVTLKEELQTQREELVQQIKIYPVLRKIWLEYEALLQQPTSLKIVEQTTSQQLLENKQKFKRYADKWEAHQALQQQIDALDKQLATF